MTLERKVLLESLKLAMPGIESGNVVLQGSDSFVFPNPLRLRIWNLLPFDQWQGIAYIPLA